MGPGSKRFNFPQGGILHCTECFKRKIEFIWSMSLRLFRELIRDIFGTNFPSLGSLSEKIGFLIFLKSFCPRTWIKNLVTWPRTDWHASRYFIFSYLSNYNSNLPIQIRLQKFLILKSFIFSNSISN